MKKTIIFLCCLLMITTLTIAQEKQTVFGYGLSTDFLSIPLTEQSLTTQSTNAFVTCSINENLNFRIGYDGVLVKDLTEKRFDNYSGLLLGAGYAVWHDPSTNFSTEITATISNSFSNFLLFNDYHADLGLRFMMFKSFYLGTGLRFSRNETTLIASNSLNSLNWYMQMGIQLNIGRK